MMQFFTNLLWGSEVLVSVAETVDRYDIVLAV